MVEIKRRNWNNSDTELVNVDISGTARVTGDFTVGGTNGNTTIDYW